MRTDLNLKKIIQVMKKKKILISLAFCSSVLFFGCLTNDNTKAKVDLTTELSSKDKETAKKEISARIEEIIKGAKELNIEAAMKPYSNDTYFKIVNPDASISDYSTMKNTQAEGFKTLTSLNFTTIKQDFTFLKKDLVMCTWTGRNEFQLKSGERMKIDPYVGSMLFLKKDNEWKIIYAHETTASPVTIK
jgi:uncharacterized membrane protein